jgi:hypothetical protein
MAFGHGKDARLLADAVALTGYLRSWEHTTERELADVTVHGNDGHRYVPGLDSGSLSLAGVWDTNAAAGGQDATLAAARGASNASVITAAPAGLAVGNRVISIEARESTYTVAAPVADAVAWSASWMAQGRVDVGVALHDLEAETADGSGTSVDNGASSAGGGVGVLHVTAFSGLTSADVAVQHSADDETWVDLVAFTQVTEATSERVVTTATVNQHLRAEWDVEGTGSATFAVAFARR